MKPILFSLLFLVVCSYSGIPASVKADSDCEGKYGCEHGTYHDDYQLMYKMNSKCRCTAGECRPAQFRINYTRLMKGSDVYSEWDVEINGVLIPVPKSAIIERDKVPKKLKSRGHVCAEDIYEYNTSTGKVHPRISCAVPPPTPS